MKKGTITICGREVEMLYCAAAETGYEKLSGKSSDIFNAYPLMKEGQPVKDADGKQVYEKPKATLEDYINLAYASIVSFYATEDKEPPITLKDILLQASAAEVQKLVETVARLRAEWYIVPDVIPENEGKDSDEKKG